MDAYTDEIKRVFQESREIVGASVEGDDRLVFENLSRTIEAALLVLSRQIAGDPADAS
jgi:hypothetical protein